MRFLCAAAVLVGACAAGTVFSGEPAADPPAGEKAVGKDEAAKAKTIVELVGNDRVEGTLLRRDDTHVYLYVGGRVISLPHDKIKSIKGSGDEGEIQGEKKFPLFKTAQLPIKNVQTLVENLGPAVVVVKTPAGLGTGWFCNREGYLVTNNHVVAGERSITVTMFRREKEGFGKEVFKKIRIIALNDDIDLALLKVEDEIDIEYPQLYIGDSASLKVGDKCFAVGNPLGLERSTSEGIISKVSRNYGGRLYLQTTAPIAPGNSGGPLFNERGEVVGVVNMGYIFLDGLGFAIPSKYVKEFLNNVEAFAYDEDNPNSGTQYMEPPVTSTDGTINFATVDFIKTGYGIRCLTLEDVNRDGVREIIFANNNKAEIGIARLRGEGDAEEEKLSTDFEDINQIPDSRFFTLDTIPVSSKVSSLSVTDMNGDARPDIVFHGDIDGLAVLHQKEDGSFTRPKKIDDVKTGGGREAVRVADLEGDGTAEIVVLGPEELTVFRNGAKDKTFPLHGGYAGRITAWELLDTNGDKRLDLVFFTVDKHYAAYVRPQNASGEFIEEFPIRSHLSGPIHPYGREKGIRFITLDKGVNRVRELHLTKEACEKNVPEAPLTLAVDQGVSVADCLEVEDLDGDGRAELLTVDAKKNAFVIYRYEGGTFTSTRSPGPKAVAQSRAYAGAGGKAALFSLSRTEKIFGISTIEKGRVSFPRPINTAGTVELMVLEQIDGDTTDLLWVEKAGGKFRMHAAPAETLLAGVYDGKEGSIDVTSRTLRFGAGEDTLGEQLSQKPAHISFGDFNGDEIRDVVVYWSYSGKESLYVGMGEGRFREIIKDQNFLEEQKGQPLLVEDVDGDGRKDILLVKPEFVRVIKVDGKSKLFVSRQINWEFDPVTQLAFFDTVDGTPRFAALTARQAKLVRLDTKNDRFVTDGRVDLQGLAMGGIKTADIDGNGKPDIILLGPKSVDILLARPERAALDSKVVLNAKLDYFLYWNVYPTDLDGDGTHEVLLFDRRKAMFEVCRPDAEGGLQTILRHRLFEKTIFQRRQTDALEIPSELDTADVNGDGSPDFVCLLQDRVGIYLQGSKGGAAAGKGPEKKAREKGGRRR